MKRFVRHPPMIVAVALTLATLATFAMIVALPSDGATLDGQSRYWRNGAFLIGPVRNGDSPLLTGDLIREVSGVPAEEIANAIFQVRRIELHWERGETVSYLVERDGAVGAVEVTLSAYPIVSVLRREWASLVPALITLLIGLFVFWRVPAQPAAGALLIYGSSATASFLSSMRVQITDVIYRWPFWGFLVTDTFAWSLLFCSLLHFSLVFPVRAPIVRRIRWFIPAVYLFPWLVHVVWVPLSLARAETKLEWIGSWENDFIVVQMLYTAAALGIFIWQYMTNRQVEARKMARWVLFGAIFDLGYLMLLGVIPEYLFGRPLATDTTGEFLNLVFPICIAIAIVRHGLFDIDRIVDPALVWGITSAFVLGTYVIIVGTIGNALSTGNGDVWPIVAAAIVAVLFQPIRTRVQRFVDRWIFGDRRDPYEVVSQMAKRIEQTVSPNAVLQTIVDTIAQSLRLPYAALSLPASNGMTVAASCGDEPTNRHDTTRLPLTYSAEHVGELIIASRTPGEVFSAEDRYLLENLASQIGSAAYAVRLTEDLQRSRERIVTAREEERRRIRNDLHDELGPVLSGLTMKVETARTRIDDPVTDALLNDVSTRARQAVADIRRLVYSLRPPALDELGLIRAIQETSAHLGLVAEFELIPLEELIELPAAAEVALYRIAIESLTNVSRHSGQKACRIHLSKSENWVVLLIEDSGTGRTISNSSESGIGLSSMRERAEELGGTCVIEHLKQGGTRVSTRIPLRPLTIPPVPDSSEES